MSEGKSANIEGLICAIISSSEFDGMSATISDGEEI